MITRRRLVQTGASVLAFSQFNVRSANAKPATILRPVPSSGERLPVIGMGTSRTFDKAADAATVSGLSDVMAVFFAGGGQVIDSSPMYGQAESRVGDVL